MGDSRPRLSPTKRLSRRARLPDALNATYL